MLSSVADPVRFARFLFHPLSAPFTHSAVSVRVNLCVINDENAYPDDPLRTIT
jgi:hypothetical protein